MPALKNPATRLLRDKIRYAQEPDNPMLINLWLSMDTPAPQQTKRDDVWQHFEDQFRLLLETLVDELLPAHWRRSCLDQIYQPLSSLARLSHTPQEQQKLHYLQYELVLSCEYVEASLSA